MTSIAVVGATGALGKEVLAVLDKAPWRPDRVFALASNRSSVPSVEYGEQSLSVDDIEQASFDDLDAVILAAPALVAREIGERAIGDGASVVDCSGAFGQDPDVPLIVPWVNPEALRELPPRGVIAVPSAPAILLGSFLGPLWRAGLAGPVDATVLVPASSEGRAGIEELSRQVVALFNSSTPPRKVFEQGLAFDLLPQLGEALADGWTDRERRTVAELERLLGSAVEANVTLVGVPVFSGISATVHLEIAGELPLERIAQILQQGGVQIPKGARQIPRPRKVEGLPFVQVGRLREGRGLHAWLALDNLRGAAAVAVGCCGALVKGRGDS